MAPLIITVSKIARTGYIHTVIASKLCARLMKTGLSPYIFQPRREKNDRYKLAGKAAIDSENSLKDREF